MKILVKVNKIPFQNTHVKLDGTRKTAPLQKVYKSNSSSSQFTVNIHCCVKAIKITFLVMTLWVWSRLKDDMMNMNPRRDGSLKLLTGFFSGLETFFHFIFL